MALDPTSAGYAAGAHDDAALPIFDVQKVQMRFDIAADFVAAQVANNVLVLALSTGRILRFDLDNPEDIDDIDGLASEDVMCFVGLRAWEAGSRHRRMETGEAEERRECMSTQSSIN